MSTSRKLAALGAVTATATLFSLASCTAILGDFTTSAAAGSDGGPAGDGSQSGDGAPQGDGGPGVGTFTIAATPSTEFIQPGKTAQVAITVARNQLADPITIAITGLPAGVIAAPLDIAAGAASGSLVLTAAASAIVGTNASATITATSGTVTAAPQKLDVTVSGPTGTLDTSYPATLPFTSALGVIGDALVQADGKILLFGTFHKVAGDAPSLVMRLNPDATIDTTFTLGAIKTAVASPAALAVAGLLQTDGKIVVAWTQGAGGVLNFTRLTAAGTLDPTWTVNPATSTVSTNGGFVSESPQVVALAEDKDGSLVYGQFQDSSTVLAWRFTSAGIADPSLGTMGNFGNRTFAKAEPVLSISNVQSVFPQTDGTYYFLGYGVGEPVLSMDVLARTTSAFVADTTFGPSTSKGGWETVSGKFNVNESVQIGNTVYSAGIISGSCTTSVTFCVASFTVASGDATVVGLECPTTTTGLGCNDAAVRIAVGPSSTLLVAGFSTIAGGVPIVARYTTSPLTVDTTFGNHGVAALRGAQTPVAVVPAPDGTTLIFDQDATYPIQRVWP